MPVETVRGPVPADSIGMTLMHEHAVCDLWEYHLQVSYDGVMDEEDVIAQELRAFKDAGGSCLVEVTNIGIGRDPAALARVAAASGVTIVMGSGWYRERVYPAEVRERTSIELAARIVAEFADGVDGTGIKPGIIGEIATDRFRVSAAEERVFRAAALAQREIGVSITTHTSNSGELALEQIEMLTAEGVPQDRIVIGHLGDGPISQALAIAARGVFVEVDHIGYGPIGPFKPDAYKAGFAAALVEAGHIDQLLLSMDVCKLSQLHAYGGKGYDHLLRSFVPLLGEAGLTDAQVRTILVENPRRVLSH